MTIWIEEIEGLTGDRLPIEVVERKGLGHPDSICDALAERLSCALSQFYLDRFGAILHHNVDKVLLRGGSAEPAFGGGKVTEPVEVYFAGRATAEFKGVKVPLQELLVEGSREWLRDNLHALDPERHVRLYNLVRPGSADLVELFLRPKGEGRPLANDTSVGVGFAPLSGLESLAYQAERYLNTRPFKEAHPETGEDIKVMAVRRSSEITLTLGCALIGRYLADSEAYLQAKERIAQELLTQHTERNLAIEVNTADDVAAGSLFLTVTGTSAEAGDDGETGRGNRTNGLITPYRPMSIEAAAGKNSATHIGKLYNLIAGLIAADLVDHVPEVTEAQCCLVSRIGQPITEPQIADIHIRSSEGRAVRDLRRPIEEIVRDRLARLPTMWESLLTGELAIDRWPLDSGPTPLQDTQ